ncbi:MAG: hypothetical protein LBD86_05860 [Spirochaetaceae bacterium]|nr:hypothetical protein [Spirochaetaceae bacterium]
MPLVEDVKDDLKKTVEKALQATQTENQQEFDSMQFLEKAPIFLCLPIPVWKICRETILERSVVNMFDKLVKINCHSKNILLRKIAGNLPGKFYCCQINCIEIDKTVLFAHHARGCIIIAAKICENRVVWKLQFPNNFR